VYLAWQFERTLIVAEDDAEVSYLEGCTAPSYDKNQVCSFRHCSTHGLLECLLLAGLRMLASQSGSVWLQSALEFAFSL